jgi:2-polyprenyl-3-methyl-5-hydroxy-6-metoxy-1,4-benzoquinol methylase
MPKNAAIDGYEYSDASGTPAHQYLLPALDEILASLSLPPARKRIFELGCGNGAVADWLSNRGYEVVGVDPSSQGVSQARRRYPSLRLGEGSCYDNLKDAYGTFPLVLSLEVVEHVYHPRLFARCVASLLDDDGIAIISTPFHGYWKNLALALLGKWDAHFTALWDNGHIKFWSEKTLSLLFEEAELSVFAFRRVGRISPVAKSMIALVRHVNAKSSA